MWLWRNHLQARKNSFNSEHISWNEHKNWFRARLKGKATKIYIAESGKYKIGVIRFAIRKSFITVSINLNPEFFAKGLGPKVINSGTQRFIKEARPGKPIIAEIKKDNIISQKAFIKAGYKFKDEQEKKVIYSSPYNE